MVLKTANSNFDNHQCLLMYKNQAYFSDNLCQIFLTFKDSALQV